MNISLMDFLLVVPYNRFQYVMNDKNLKVSTMQGISTKIPRVPLSPKTSRNLILYNKIFRMSFCINLIKLYTNTNFLRGMLGFPIFYTIFFAVFKIYRSFKTSNLERDSISCESHLITSIKNISEILHLLDFAVQLLLNIAYMLTYMIENLLLPHHIVVRSFLVIVVPIFP